MFVVMKHKERTLKQYLQTETLDPLRVKKIVYSLLCGLKYLHQANIVHRNLQPDAILVNDEGAKLSEFGLSRTLPACCSGKLFGNSIKLRDSVLSKLSKRSEPWTEAEEHKRIVRSVHAVKNQIEFNKVCLSPRVSPLNYRAPEVVLRNKQYDQAVDIWSLGCVLS